MTKKELLIAKRNGTLEDLRRQRIRELIREVYDIEDELSIQRQKDEKPEEYQRYYEFAEDCKRKAKAEVYGDDN